MDRGVVYAANVRYGGGGMGSSVLEQIGGLERVGMLRQLIGSSVKSAPVAPNRITQVGLPGRVGKRLAFYDRSGWVEYVQNTLFDVWCSSVMQRGDVFVGWTAFSLTSQAVARRRGMRTVLQLGSAHPRHQQEILNHEHAVRGLPALTHTPQVGYIEHELQRAEHILVQSRFSLDSLTRYGIDPTKVSIIPLGADARRYQPAEQEPERFRILFLGQVTLRKGVPYLLEAWQKLGWHDAELVIAGQVHADCRAILEQYADLPGLKVLGHVPDVQACFQAASVFVAPSLEDGFAQVVTEAMACGLPVVTTTNVGAADLVLEGDAGLVVPAMNSDALANALDTLRTNDVLRRRYREKARQTALSASWDQHRARFNAFLNALV